MFGYPGKESVEVTGPITVSAKWTEDSGQSLTVRFDTAGGSPVPDAKVAPGSPVTDLPGPVREGHVFKGWYSGGTLFGEAGETSVAVTSDMTVVAMWEEDGSKWCDVEYDAGDGTPTRASDHLMIGNRVTALPGAVLEGRYLGGWTLDGVSYGIPGGESVAIEASVLKDGRVVLTAVWVDTAPPIDEVAVVYDAGDGRASRSGDLVPKGERIHSLPDASRDGYTLEGWYVDGAWFGRAGGESSVVDSPVRAVAKWVEAARWVRVSYDAGDGTADRPSENVAAGGRVHSLPGASRDGYSFQGWYVDGALFGWAGGESSAVETDVTATARWIANGAASDVSIGDGISAVVDGRPYDGGALPPGTVVEVSIEPGRETSGGLPGRIVDSDGNEVRDGRIVVGPGPLDLKIVYGDSGDAGSDGDGGSGSILWIGAAVVVLAVLVAAFAILRARNGS